MNCDEAGKLIHAHLDGELDLLHSLEMDRHLASCAACAAAARGIEDVRAAVRNQAPRYAASPEFVERLRAMSDDVAVAGVVQPAPAERRMRWQSLAAAAAVIAVMAVGWSLMHANQGQSASNRLALEVFSSHIRSLMPQGEHLMDVPSSDRHTVKPWFAGKIDFSPRVEDFKEQGFTLAGGRLDVLDGRPAAVLIYRRGGHIVNLFMQPEADFPGAGDERIIDTYHGYHLVTWHDDALHYWAVSDMAREELEQFAALWRDTNPKR
jgi:anti-sigma factor RsiW